MDRKVERITTDNEWEGITLKQLKIGDFFRMWDFIDYKNTWELYTDDDGEQLWKVVRGPYTHPIYNIWTIHVSNWMCVCPVILWDQKHLIYGLGKKETTDV